jgi:hypothetical protein
VFVVHLELVTEDQIVHRVSISSMYKEESLRVCTEQHAKQQVTGYAGQDAQDDSRELYACH